MSKLNILKPENPCGVNVYGGGTACKQQLKKLLVNDKKSNSKEVAFTLAEILITVSILGIVAAITIPSIINKVTERQNKVKFKKALSVYERVVSQAELESGLNSVQAINQWANSDSKCSNSLKYFKPKATDIDNPCVFRTADGVWWNISNLSRTIVSVDKNLLTEYNAFSLYQPKAFMLTFESDNSGALRVNDIGYATDASSSVYSTFVNKIKTYLFSDEKITRASLIKKYSNACEGDIRTNCTNYTASNKSKKVYDENGNLIITETKCDNDFNNCQNYTLYERINIGNGLVKQYSHTNCQAGESCKGNVRAEIFYYNSNNAKIVLMTKNKCDYGIKSCEIACTKTTHGKIETQYSYLTCDDLN